MNRSDQYLNASTKATVHIDTFDQSKPLQKKLIQIWISFLYLTTCTCDCNQVGINGMTIVNKEKLGQNPQPGFVTIKQRIRQRIDLIDLMKYI